jgi:ABC-type transport system involved in multi-copper enzyme maturation permease subunit
VPSALSTVRTLAGITLTRLLRGKALWIGAVIAALPVVFAAIVRSRPGAASPELLFQSSRPVLALLPALFVGGSIGEAIEDRTSTYLWSRPIARWAVLVGTLGALAPVAVLQIVAAWFGAIEVATGAAPTLASCLALTGGAIASSLVATGIATVLPKHGMAMTIGYMLVDIFIGLMPFSLREISITQQTTVLAGFDHGSPPSAGAAIALTAASGLWLAIGLLRVRRLEV